MIVTDIADLVPQSGAMCLLDRVIRHDRLHIVCGANGHRRAGHPLALPDGRLLAVVSLEYAAQAAAVHGSLIAKQDAASVAAPVRSGFLASARDFKLYVPRLDDLAAELVVRAKRLMDARDSVLYEFRVESDGCPVSEGRLAVFFTDEI